MSPRFRYLTTLLTLGAVLWAGLSSVSHRHCEGHFDPLTAAHAVPDATQPCDHSHTRGTRETRVPENDGRSSTPPVHHDGRDCALCRYVSESSWFELPKAPALSEPLIRDLARRDPRFAIAEINSRPRPRSPPAAF